MVLGAVFDRYAPQSDASAAAAVMGVFGIPDRMVLTLFHRADASAFVSGLPAPRAGGGHAACVRSAIRGSRPTANHWNTCGARASMDLAAYGNHTMQFAAFLAQIYPDRFDLRHGNSKALLPQIAARVARGDDSPRKVALIDGNHRFKGAYEDMKNMRASVSPGAPIVLDDIEGPVAVAVAAVAVGRVSKKRGQPVTPDPERHFNICLRWIAPACAAALSNVLRSRAVQTASARDKPPRAPRACEVCFPQWGWARAEYATESAPAVRGGGA